MATHLDTGKIGEEVALKYLEKQGFSILENNWRYKHLEIDIVALDKDILCIVEVKTRKTDSFGQPEVFVDKAKQQKLIKAANHYVNQKRLNHEIRFDIVSVIEAGTATKVVHLKDAFYPLVKK